MATSIGRLNPLTRKILIITTISLGVFLIAAIILPMVIKIDHFRPQIVETLNKKFNGSVELGEMKLKILGGLGAEIEGVKIFSGLAFGKEELISVAEARVKTSLLSIIFRRPKATFVLEQPSIKLVKNKSGTWNVIDFVNVTKEHVAEGAVAVAGSAGKPLPYFVKNASVSIRLNNSTATIVDNQTGSTTNVRDLQLSLEDVAMGSPIKFSLGFKTSGTFGTYRLEGPIRIDGKLKVDFDGHDISNGYIVADFDCSKTDVILPEIFQKSSGIDCRISIDSKLKDNVAQIQKATVELHTLKASASGTVKDISSQPNADITFEVQPIKIKDWHEVLFALKNSPVVATVTMKGGMSGSLTKPVLWADISLLGGSGRVNGLAPSISDLHGDFAFNGDSLTIKSLSANLGSSAINLSGKISNFKHPYIAFNLTSPSMNLTNILGKRSEKISVIPQALASTGRGGSSSGKEANFGFLNKYSGNGHVKIGTLTIDKAVLSDFVSDVKFGGGSMSLSQSALAWGGSIRSNVQLSDGGSLARYVLNGSINNIDLVKVAEAYGSKEAKLRGRLNGSLNLNGVGTSKQSLKSNLKGSGAVNIIEGEIADLNVGKQVQAALGTISALSGTPIHEKEFDRRFQRIAADISVGGGKISTNNMIATTSQIEMSGSGYADMDENLNFHGQVRIPPDFVNIAGIDLRDNTGKVPIPFQLAGTVGKPSFNLDVATLGAHVALKLAERELKRKLGEAIGGQATKPDNGGGLPIPVQIPLPW